MRTKNLLSILSASLLITASAQAQFSITTNTGSLIPASGAGGGMFPDGGQTGALPVAPGTATLNVPHEVVTVSSVVILGLNHSWGGDLQATLTDPNMVEHNLFLRPGYNNPSGNFFGTPGDFVTGDFRLVSSGGQSLPTLANGADIDPGNYNQSSSTGGYNWTSGDLGIMNTAYTGMGAPAGDWTLKIYDWGFGDSGVFAGFTLNGFEPGAVNPGSAYCFGDGTGTICPCSAFGGAGEGCLNTSGSGMLLVGTGVPNILSDSLVLSVSGGPAGKPGIFFQGPNQLNSPVGDGIVCSNSNLRYGVTILDATGAANATGFGANATAGGTLNYQFWYRDTQNPCGAGGFNFSNGWVVTW